MVIEFLVLAMLISMGTCCILALADLCRSDKRGWVSRMWVPTLYIAIVLMNFLVVAMWFARTFA